MRHASKPVGHVYSQRGPLAPAPRVFVHVLCDVHHESSTAKRCFSYRKVRSREGDVWLLGVPFGRASLGVQSVTFRRCNDASPDILRELRKYGLRTMPPFCLPYSHFLPKVYTQALCHMHSCVMCGAERLSQATKRLPFLGDQVPTATPWSPPLVLKVPLWLLLPLVFLGPARSLLKNLGLLGPAGGSSDLRALGSSQKLLAPPGSCWLLLALPGSSDCSSWLLGAPGSSWVFMIAPWFILSLSRAFEFGSQPKDEGAREIRDET